MNAQTLVSATPRLAPPQPQLDPESARLLGRICVRPPYFGLRGLRSREPGAASALVTPEQPLGAEAGPIAAAELGRHLAILGSAAIASRYADDEQRYYLARAAHFERVCGELKERAPTLVAEATAGADFDGSRNALARCVMSTPEGVATHLLTVQYAVLGARVFERSMRAHRQATPKSERNPHAEPLLLSMQALDARHARATTRFSVEQCAGHFDGCPAVPVARLMQGLITLAGHLVQHRLHDPDARITVLRGDVRAHRLAFAGDELLLRAVHVRDRGAELGVQCVATLLDGTPIGELTTWLTSADRRA